MARMKSGDLRHPVTLLRPDTRLDEKNRRQTEWTEAAHVHAQKTDVSGKEFWQAHAVNAEDIVTFTIRYRTDVETTWRIRHGESVYNIIEVNHLGYMTDYIRLKCRIVTGGGR